MLQSACSFPHHGVCKVASRLLFEGKHTSYEELLPDLEAGEQLMATYLDNVRNPVVVFVEDETTFNDITDGAYDSQEGDARTGWKFFNLRWFASTTGSTRP